MALFKDEAPVLGDRAGVDSQTWASVVPLAITTARVLGPISASTVQGYWLCAGVPEACTVVGIRANYTTAGPASLTASVRKITDGTSAPSASAGATVVELLASALPLDATANVQQIGTLSTTASALQLNAKDQIGVSISSATQTGLVGLTIEVLLQRRVK